MLHRKEDSSGCSPAVSCRGLPEPSKSSLGLRLEGAEGGIPGQGGAVLGPSRLKPILASAGVHCSESGWKPGILDDHVHGDLSSRLSF